MSVCYPSLTYSKFIPHHQQFLYSSSPSFLLLLLTFRQWGLGRQPTNAKLLLSCVMSFSSPYPLHVLPIIFMFVTLLSVCYLSPSVLLPFGLWGNGLSGYTITRFSQCVLYSASVLSFLRSLLIPPRKSHVTLIHISQFHHRLVFHLAARLLWQSNLTSFRLSIFYRLSGVLLCPGYAEISLLIARSQFSFPHL